MKRINEILAVVILSLLAVLVAAVGMRLYDTYVVNGEIEAEWKQQEEVLSRNREAHDRVQEMRREIEALSRDREKLGQFLEEIRMDYEEAVPVAAMMDFDMSGMSGGQEIAEELQGVSENADHVSDAMMSPSENGTGLTDDKQSLSEKGRMTQERALFRRMGQAIPGLMSFWARRLMCQIIRPACRKI